MNRFLKQLKKHFIPHEENDYKPHFFATASIFFSSAIIVVAFLLSVLQYVAISSNSNFLASVVSSVLVDITNEDRAANGKEMLQTSPILTRAAQAKANDMAAKSYFAHTSPEGVTSWYWFDQAGYSFSYAGENLAVNFSDSANVGEAWMNSPGHKANILNDKFTEIGIATAQGMYNGQQTTFIVQLFGRPAPMQVFQQGGAIVKKETKDVDATKNSTTTVALKGSEVAGTSLETVVVNDMFIAVKNNNATETKNIVPTNENQASLWGRILTSPQTTLKYVYLVFSVLIVFALALDTFIEIRRRHPIHIVYALLLWILILALLYVAGTYVFPRVVVV